MAACRRCAYKGTTSELRLYHINFSEAIYLCPNKKVNHIIQYIYIYTSHIIHYIYLFQCTFPLDDEDVSQYLIKCPTSVSVPQSTQLLSNPPLSPVNKTITGHKYNNRFQLSAYVKDLPHRTSCPSFDKKTIEACVIDKIIPPTNTLAHSFIGSKVNSKKSLKNVTDQHEQSDYMKCLPNMKRKRRHSLTSIQINKKMRTDSAPSPVYEIKSEPALKEEKIFNCMLGIPFVAEASEHSLDSVDSLIVKEKKHGHKDNVSSVTKTPGKTHDGATDGVVCENVGKSVELRILNVPKMEETSVQEYGNVDYDYSRIKTDNAVSMKTFEPMNHITAVVKESTNELVDRICTRNLNSSVSESINDSGVHDMCCTSVDFPDKLDNDILEEVVFNIEDTTPIEVETNIVPLKQHPSEIIKYMMHIQWMNKDALCWLDVLLCMFVHCQTLQKYFTSLKQSGGSLLHNLLDVYNRASELHSIQQSIYTNLSDDIVKTGGGEFCMDYVRVQKGDDLVKHNRTLGDITNCGKKSIVDECKLLNNKEEHPR